MAAFDYVAVDEGGRTVRGTLTAVDDGSLRARLARRRLMPLEVTASRGAVRNSDAPARKGGVLGRLGPARGGLDPRTLALVTRQLATLVTVSPVEEALRAIALQADR
ncbi:MAG: type secretion system inner membrane protein GspF, partial [Pseudomonadota bacterium]